MFYQIDNTGEKQSQVVRVTTVCFSVVINSMGWYVRYISPVYDLVLLSLSTIDLYFQIERKLEDNARNSDAQSREVWVRHNL